MLPKPAEPAISEPDQPKEQEPPKPVVPDLLKDDKAMQDISSLLQPSTPKETGSQPKSSDGNCFKKFFTFKKVINRSSGGITAVAGVAGTLPVGNQATPRAAEDDDDEDNPVEIKYLPDSDAKELATFLTHFHGLDASLEVIQFLCRTVYHTAAVVPRDENGWLPKVCLLSMQLFSIVRHFIQPGMEIHLKKFEGVLRHFIVDPCLSPQLIGALSESGMLVPKKGDRHSVLLIEPAVKDAIDEVQALPGILKMLETPYPSLVKVQEKLLVAVFSAIEEYNDPRNRKATGKKLSAHVSYLVKEIVWPRKHPGFSNLQAKIPQLIKYCSEAIIAIAKQRYESLPNVSDDELKLFKRAYARAQEEKTRLRLGKAAGVGLAAGAGLLGAGLSIGAMGVINDDDDDSDEE